MWAQELKPEDKAVQSYVHEHLARLANQPRSDSRNQPHNREFLIHESLSPHSFTPPGSSAQQPPQQPAVPVPTRLASPPPITMGDHSTLSTPLPPIQPHYPAVLGHSRHAASSLQGDVVQVDSDSNSSSDDRAFTFPPSKM